MPVDQARLHRALNPRTLVVVGDKGPNFSWLTNNEHFTGDLYSVQVDEKEIEEIEKRGFTNFTRLEDVPGDVDLLISAVPRNVLPYIVHDAVEKGVAGIAAFTAGFAETGEAEGIQLQDAIVQMANDAGMVLVGPNCMGVYNRRLGVKFHSDVSHGEGGNVSFIGQSGTHTIGMTVLAERQGIKVTRAISFGNAAVVNESDYLEYLADDDDTEVIGVYIEGVQDGRRFFETLRDVTRRKPVVIWKGGQTEVGARATRSHTASLATPADIWDAMVRQAGAIPVTNIDEAIDVITGLVHIGGATAPGRRLALMAMTGGQSVAISDAFGRAGLDVPALSDRSYERLAEFFNIIGGSFRNPFDMANTIGIAGDSDNLTKILDILAEDEAIDTMVFEFSAGFFVSYWKKEPERFTKMLDNLDAFRERTKMPLITVMHPGHQEAEVLPIRELVVERGYAVYSSFDRAALALSRIVGHYERAAAE